LSLILFWPFVGWTCLLREAFGAGTGAGETLGADTDEGTALGAGTGAGEALGAGGALEAGTGDSGEALGAGTGAGEAFGAGEALVGAFGAGEALVGAFGGGDSGEELVGAFGAGEGEVDSLSTGAGGVRSATGAGCTGFFVSLESLLPNKNEKNPDSGLGGSGSLSIFSDSVIGLVSSEGNIDCIFLFVSVNVLEISGSGNCVDDLVVSGE